MLKTTVVLSLALVLLNCQRSSEPQPPAPPSHPQAKCTTELAHQRDLALEAISKGEGALAEAATECRKFESMVPANLSACILEDGKLASLEPDIAECKTAEDRAAAQAEEKKTQEEKKAQQESEQNQTQALEQVQTQRNTGVEVKALKSDGDAKKLYVGQTVLVGGDRVGTVGANVDSRGNVSVGFFDPNARTETSESMPAEKLVAALEAPQISMCDVSESLGATTFASGPGNTVYRIVNAFPDGLLEVEPMVVSQRLVSYFDPGYSLVPTESKIIEGSAIKGLQVKCLKGICEGDRVYPTSPIAHFRRFVASRVFCNGTLVVRAYTFWGVYTELISSVENYTPDP